ncbi:hypothetical protein SCHIN_v1c06190 [Spiroplasma chinense]|uniref:Shikimate kinase n=1 Tax=Spiroplasma chinense TaxID=216932 RepID=A0A5B9Y536_9MOLU|nr:hypothetical protein [Spiroplasma chinense]QEH61816.1 hypothetical protein SCHIN_v1c06190 [Spiroplasma chinense]
MKIQILGLGCSGKTVLAKYLSKKLGLTYIDASKYLEIENVGQRFDKYAKDILMYDSWIVDGHTGEWMIGSFYKSDYIICIDISDEDLIARVNELELRNDLFLNKNIKIDDKYNEQYYNKVTDLEYLKKQREEIKIRLEITKAKILLIDGTKSLKQNYYKILEFLVNNGEGK